MQAAIAYVVALWRAVKVRGVVHAALEASGLRLGSKIKALRSGHAPRPVGDTQDDGEKMRQNHPLRTMFDAQNQSMARPPVSEPYIMRWTVSTHPVMMALPR